MSRVKKPGNFAKYDISYKTYRNKSKQRREELRSEYEVDTKRG